MSGRSREWEYEGFVARPSKVPLRESILSKLGFDEIGCEGIDCGGMKGSTNARR